jgi:hypothetical protein
MYYPTTARHIGLYLLFFSLFSATGFSQASLTGLWEVREVTAGEEVMTPVAKWFRLEADQQFHAGNGYLRNMTGTWTADTDQHTLLFTDQYGNPDPGGPFLYQLDGDQLRLQRVEEGMDITVHLLRTDQQPRAPWDQLVGEWILQQEDGAAEAAIFLRWDRRYVGRNFEPGGAFGVWHFHAHRPELRLLSDRGDDFDARWEVAFPEENVMTWTGQEEGEEEVLTFQRLIRP